MDKHQMNGYRCKVSTPFLFWFDEQCSLPFDWICKVEYIKA